MIFKPVPLLGPPRISTSLAVPAAHHNYSLGGEMVNAFALGRIGADDDLWLVAAEPPAEGEGASAALISGNILDAFGRRLAAIERNRMTWGAPETALESTEDGWRLSAGGQAILEVRTRYAHAPGCALTYIHGLLRDKRGAVRLETRGGRNSPSLVVHGRFAYGFRPDGVFGQNHGLTDEEMAQAGAIMRGGAGTPAGG